MRYGPEHNEATRQRLVDEASRCLRGEGPDAVSVGTVMGRAGLTKGTFYTHFASREEMLEAAVERAFEDAWTMLDRAIEGAEPREAVRRYVASYLSERHLEAPSIGCPLAALASDASRLPPRARRRFAANSEALRGRIAELLEAAGHADASMSARALMAELVGGLALARAGDDEAARHDALAALRTDLVKRRA